MTEPDRKLKVFLCHAKQDKALVRELYQRLSAEGWVDAWLDDEKLLPGMKWEYEITKALDASDAVCVCISNTSVTKEGFVQRELRFVVDLALEKPDETIFILPVRLEECQPPHVLKPYQWADYFPSERRDGEYARLLRSLKVRAAGLGIETDIITMPNANVELKSIASLNYRYPSASFVEPEIFNLPPDRLTLVGMEFCRISAGKFLMGSNDEDKLARDNEKPQHTPELPDYWMGRYPVTNEQYARYLKGKKRNHPVNDWRQKPNHPVVNVSWDDTQDYLKWLNISWQGLRWYGDSKFPLRSNFILRLPTEAEWEKAARGPYSNIWPWGDEFDLAKCNSAESQRSGTTPVGAYSPQGDSPYGCADMAGNVWEWMESVYKPYPYNLKDGRENLRNAARVSLRGGSWYADPVSARISNRSYGDPNGKNNYIGFRVAAVAVNTPRD